MKLTFQFRKPQWNNACNADTTGNADNIGTVLLYKLAPHESLNLSWFQKTLHWVQIKPRPWSELNPTCQNHDFEWKPKVATKSYQATSIKVSAVASGVGAFQHFFLYHQRIQKIIILHENNYWHVHQACPTSKSRHRETDQDAMPISQEPHYFSKLTPYGSLKHCRILLDMWQNGMHHDSNPGGWLQTFHN